MKSRSEVLQDLSSISTQGGVYFWYVTKQGADILQIPLEGCKQKQGMYLVYIGLSKNLRMRMKWHNGDEHRVSSIKSGTLSILRQKVSSLLCNNWHSKAEVDQFMEQHMKVEWVVNPNYEDVEIQLIKDHTLPLNFRNNKHPFMKPLSKLNSASKKNSLAYFNLI